MDIDKLTIYIHNKLNPKIVELSNDRCGQEPMCDSLYWMCEGSIGEFKFDSIYASPFWEVQADDGEDHENINVVFCDINGESEDGPNITFKFSELTFDAETDARLYIEKMETLFSKMKLIWLKRVDLKEYFLRMKGIY